MRTTAELTIHPFDTLLGIVLGVGKEVIQFALAEWSTTQLLPRPSVRWK